MQRAIVRWAVVWCVLGGAAEPRLFAQETIKVPVAAPIVQEVETFATAEGRIVPSKNASLRPRVSGVVTKVLLPFGGEVQQGDVLFELDARRYEAEFLVKQAGLKRAQAAMTRAKMVYENTETLAKKNTTSPGEAALSRTSLDESQAAVEEAQAQLAIAQLDLDACRVTAPFSGKLGRSRVNEGEQVSPGGDALTTLAVVDPVAVEWSLAESQFKRISTDKPKGLIGAEFQVKFPDAQDALKAPVSYVGDSTGAGSRDRRHSLIALLPNPEGRLTVGTTVEVSISAGRQKLPLLPERALVPAQPGRFGGRPAEFGGFGERGEATVAAERRPSFSPGDQVMIMGLHDDGRVWTGVWTLGQKVGDLWAIALELPPGVKVILSPGEVRDRERRGAHFEGVEETIPAPK